MARGGRSFCSRHQDEGFLISGDEHDVLRTLDFTRREHLQNTERKTHKPASVLLRTTSVLKVPSNEVVRDDFHRYRWRCIFQPERAVARC